MGAVIGVVLVGLLVWLFTTESMSGSYLGYMTQQGVAETEAIQAAAIFLALYGSLAFFYGLFLPLGYTVLNRMKNRLLEGWLVSCLLIIIIQLLFFAAVIAVGSIVGAFYLVYSIVRTATMKKRIGKNGGTAKRAADV